MLWQLLRLSDSSKYVFAIEALKIVCFNDLETWKMSR